MMYGFDSSAVVKRYAPEAGSAWVRQIMAATSDDTIYLAQVSIVEIAAALSRKVRTRELSQEAYTAALWLFLTDVRTSRSTRKPGLPFDQRVAHTRLCRNHSRSG